MLYFVIMTVGDTLLLSSQSASFCSSVKTTFFRRLVILLGHEWVVIISILVQFGSWFISFMSFPIRIREEIQFHWVGNRSFVISFIASAFGDKNYATFSSANQIAVRINESPDKRWPNKRGPTVFCWPFNCLILVLINHVFNRCASKLIFISILKRMKKKHKIVFLFGFPFLKWSRP